MFAVRDKWHYVLEMRTAKKRIFLQLEINTTEITQWPQPKFQVPVYQKRLQQPFTQTAQKQQSEIFRNLKRRNSQFDESIDVRLHTSSRNL